MPRKAIAGSTVTDSALWVTNTDDALLVIHPYSGVKSHAQQLPAASEDVSGNRGRPWVIIELVMQPFLQMPPGRDALWDSLVLSECALPVLWWYVHISWRGVGRCHDLFLASLQPS